MFNGILALAEAPELIEKLDDTRPAITTVVNRGPRGGAMHYLSGPRKRRGLTAHVNGAGHWLLTADANGHATLSCRGCGNPVDATRCPKPASHRDIATALLGRQAVAR